MSACHLAECPASGLHVDDLTGSAYRIVDGDVVYVACVCPMLTACAARVRAQIAAGVAALPYTHLGFITRREVLDVVEGTGSLVVGESRILVPAANNTANNAHKGTSTRGYKPPVNEDPRHMEGERP